MTTWRSLERPGNAVSKQTLRLQEFKPYHAQAPISAWLVASMRFSKATSKSLLTEILKHYMGFGGPGVPL